MTNILSLVASAQLLEQSAVQVDAIRTAAGLTEAQFNALCIPLLRAYANRVQNLPYSPSVFSRAQGAWQFGLVCATVTYQVAGTVIFFPDMGAEERRVIEKQCRFMSFIATLATCVSMVTAAVKITDGDVEYHPLLTNQPLNEWLAVHPSASFNWRTSSAPLSSQICAAIASRFVPAGLLEKFDLRAVLMIFDAIAINTKLVGVESTISRVVRQSVQRVLQHYTELEARSFKDGQATQPAHAADPTAIAANLISQANLTLPTNPLAAPHDTTPPPQQANAAPTPPPAERTLPPEDKTATAAPTEPAQPHPVAPGTHDAPQQAGSSPKGDVDPLAGADQVLVEWFKALKDHARYPDLAKHLVTSTEGIQVPINMLGLFGVSGPSIRKKMDDAGFVVRRSDDARSVILIPSLRDHFFASAPADSSDNI